MSKILITNSTNRDSDQPTTEYRIVFSMCTKYMGTNLRQLTISAVSPFKAFKVFQSLHEHVYKHSLIKEIEQV